MSSLAAAVSWRNSNSNFETRRIFSNSLKFFPENRKVIDLHTTVCFNHPYVNNGTLYPLTQIAVPMTPLGNCPVIDFAFLTPQWRFHDRCTTDSRPLFSGSDERSAAPSICTRWRSPAIIPTKHYSKPVAILNAAVRTAPLTTSLSRRPGKALPALPRPAGD